jgi:uncharacterized repeat protein (TIGR01451 family)
MNIYKPRVVFGVNLRTFVSALCSFAILMMPFAQMAAATRAASTPTIERSNNRTARTRGRSNAAPIAGVPSISATLTDNRPSVDPAIASPGDTINYQVVISNIGSGPATGIQFNQDVDANTTVVGGSVKMSPVVSTQPADQTACAGATASFTSAANGTPAPTVQWQVDSGSGFSDVSGATSTTLSVSTLAGDNGKQYRAVFTNTLGTMTTNAAALRIDTLPVVSTNPLTQTSCAGATVTFTAAATSNAGQTVQWQVDSGSGFSDIPGETSTTLSFTAAAADNGKKYRAVFTDACGSANTSSAMLTVNTAPSVTTNPGDQGTQQGSSVSFTAAANGSPAPTVQWQVNSGSGFNDIPGATNTTYTHTAQLSENGYKYRAVFTNSCGDATTTAATLTVTCQTITVTNPTNSTGTFDSAFSAQFTQSDAIGTATFSTASTLPDGLTLSSSGLLSGTPTQSGTFQIVVTVIDSNSCTGTGLTYPLSIDCPGITINPQPTGQTVCDGATATFTSGTTSPSFTVQWQVDAGSGFNNLPGATTTTLSFAATAADNGKQYRAVFDNGCGTATSNAATLTVNTAPVVTDNPSNQTVTDGDPVTFTAAANGSPAPTVQWQVSTDNGTIFNNIPGATSTSFSHIALLSEDQYQYRAVFTNVCDSATTSAATLTVTPAPPNELLANAAVKEKKIEHLRSLPEHLRANAKGGASGIRSLNHAPAASANRHSEVATSAVPPSCSTSSTHVCVDVGTLLGGQSVTITFSITINAPYGGGANVSTQGTVSGGNFSNVSTDDPDTGTANDATLTPVCSSSITVANLNDSGAGSLRQAILDLCPAGGTISFDSALTSSAAATITLTSGELVLDKNITINGPTNHGLTISGNNASRVLNVQSGKSVTLSALTISNGLATQGGGILNAGTLIITNSTISNNHTTNGANSSGPGVNGGSSGDGGGIYNANTGTLKLFNSTISGNQPGKGGDASGTDTAGNGGNGGGIFNGGGSVTSVNTTITNNKTGANGDNTTVEPAGPFGTAGTGGGIRNSGGTILLRNTIVAGNFSVFQQLGPPRSFANSDDDINGAVDPASANNLVGVDTGMTGITNSNQGNKIGTAATPLSALLFSLADNGGPTFTHLPQDGSPAVDAGDNTLAKDQNNNDLTTDQRGAGLDRIVNSTVDMGSVETNPNLGSAGVVDFGVTKLADADQVVAGSNVTFTITVFRDGSDVANVTLTDNLPIGTDVGMTAMQFVSLNAPAGWGCTTPLPGAGGQVKCSRSLGATSGEVFTLVGKIPNGTAPGTVFNNIANVKTPATDPTDENNNSTGVTTVTPPYADLSLIKNGPPQARPNTDVTYTITVTNMSANAATTVHFSDTLPSSVPGGFAMTFVSFSQTSGPAWNCPSPAATTSCSIATLPANSTSVFSFVGHVAAGVLDGSQYTNETKVISDIDPNSENDTGSFVTTIASCFTDPIVTTNANSGQGSLRQAIIDACSGATIRFDMTQVVSPITLTSAELLLDKNLTIAGPGANLLTVMRSTAGGTPDFRIFAIIPGKAVNISGLTVNNGKTTGDGAGINNQGTLSLLNCAVTINQTSASGGGIANDGGTLVITESTISGNTGTVAGGGIANGGTLTLINSTISGNTGDGLSNSNIANLTNDTFSDNSVRGVSSNGGATTNVRNTIVANTPGGVGDVSGAFVSQGNNLVGKSDGSTGFGVGDQVGTVASPLSALLAVLGNNGGPTQTHALLAGSPALDAGDNTAAVNAGLTTDQRGTGFARIVDGPDVDTTATVDIGAFEAQFSVEDLPDKATNEDVQLQFTFNLGGSFTSVTATSANTTLVPNNPANIALSGSGFTRTLTINPAANEFGTSTITVTVSDAGSQSMTDTFLLTVNSVNEAPGFTKGSDQVVSEDAPAQTVPNWAMNLSTGPANESGQTLTFQVTGNTNGALFSAQPAVSSNGTLSYTPAANANGSAIVTLVVQDNGGTANGGQNTSAPQSFTITVSPVNDPPSFTKGADQTVNEDAGTQTVSNWATNISAGPNESGQQLTFMVTGNTNPTLFSVAPAIGSNGTLSYTSAADANGSATITIVLKDDGGITNGGQDTSAPQTFTITVNPVNDVPSFTKGPDQTVAVNAGAQTVANWATNVSAGPSNESGQSLAFQVTGNTNSALFSAQPAISSTGTLTYTPATNVSGSATITINLKDNGGTANGGVDTSPSQTFIISVNCGSTVVTNSQDSGAGSLRDTTLAACVGSTITFDMSAGHVASPITLTSAQLSIDKNLTIQGPGANLLTISGNNANRVFNISSGAVTISDLTISQGLANAGSSPPSVGGGIRNGGNLTLNSCLVTANSASSGGGIHNAGGGILNISNSTVSGNSATTASGGGGIVNINGGTMSISNSTISGNTSNNQAGGLLNQNSTAVLINSTISGNTAGSGDGGGILNQASASNTAILTLTNCTIAANTANRGSAIFTADLFNNAVKAETLIRNTLVGANNGPNFLTTGTHGQLTNNGNNLDSDGSSGFTNGTNGNLVGAAGSPLNALLAPLGNNGGLTQTMALLPGSPAVNAGTSTGAPTTDQRGISRVGAVDIGAFESRGFTISVFSGSPQTATILSPFASPLIASVNGVGGEPVNGGIVLFTAPAANASAVLTGGGATTTITIAGGQASTNATANGTAGSYNVVASANGATPASFSLTNNKAVTTTTIASSLNPSDRNQNVTFTANVTSVVTPTGLVQFKDNGANFAAPTALNASGVAQVTTGALTVGNHTITADYLGDANFQPSSASLTQTVVLRSLIKFSQANYSVNENGKIITITVVRSNDTSLPVTVDFSTPDDSGAMTFLPCSNANGVASPRCDFTTALGTLRFAAGETTRTFDVLISQDLWLEGNETAQLTLSNLTGGAVFQQPSDATATLTIVDDDSSSPSTNAIDDSTTFVRQHYHDFLNREPDPTGLDFWVNQIESCGADAQCRAVKRNNVSAAFFLSIEFQNTGYFVERVYKSGFGDIAPPLVPVPVRFTNFLADSQQITNGVVVGVSNWQTQLDNNKKAFALAFVQRPAFVNRYPAITSATAFVDSLNANAGMVLSDAERSALIAQLSPNSADSALRADVLMKVAENALLQQREFNRAFVLMQYFGYLRRNPDAAPEATLNFNGYNFWVNKLNQANGDYISAELIKAFITSGEYRGRFGP